MKIAVISDTHGDKESIKHIVDSELPDAVIHLGDHASDLDASVFPSCVRVVYIVNGKCDFTKFPTELCKDIAGTRLFMMHGHTHGVKYSMSSAISTVKKHNANVLLYGHTHVPILDSRDGILLINPGSAKSHTATDSKKATYAILNIDSGVPKAMIMPLLG